MAVLTEGSLEITIRNEINARRFDDPTQHRLSHCMSAVDFVVEFDDHYLFIEVKDPQQNPDTPVSDAIRYHERLSSGLIDEELKTKYRDSLLYEWADGRADKPIYFYVIIALNFLSDAGLLNRKQALERILPLLGPNSSEWPRPIVDGCGVFNLATWNRTFPDLEVRRLS